MYLSAPFILQNFYKKILEMIQSYEDARHFRDQNNPFVLNKNFLLQTTTHPELWRCTILGPIVVHLPNFFFFFFWGGGNYYYHSHLPISPFHCAKLRAQDGPFPQIRFFFRKPVNEPCFFYSCLSTCQKSKSDINLLVKYWWLKNTEISLVESHFCL